MTNKIPLRDLIVMQEKWFFVNMSIISGEDRYQKSVSGGKIRCRGGAAIGVKTADGEIALSVSEINWLLDDYWGDDSGRYAAYAAMKVVTALQSETPTVDTGEEFSFSKAVHRGGVPAYLEKYRAWVAVGFSGFESAKDEEIATRMLEKVIQELLR